MTDPQPVFPLAMLDDRISFVGTSGSGKTHTAMGFTAELLQHDRRVCIIDPLGVWWGLRRGRDGVSPGFSLVLFGGARGEIPLAENAAQIAGVVAHRQMASIIDLSELPSDAARRRFMTVFCETLFQQNREPLHLIIDEADLFAPQKPGPDQTLLLGRINEIVRRGRVRGFIPWLISQRPAVVNKDVLSQTDTMIMMKLVSSQDRAAIRGWIDGQADKEVGARILATLPTQVCGQGYVWAPAHKLLEQMMFPPNKTFDSSRTPKRGERATPLPSWTPADMSGDLPMIINEMRKAGRAHHRRPDEHAKAAAEGVDHNAAERARLAAENARLTGEAAELRQELLRLKSVIARIAEVLRTNPVDIGTPDVLDMISRPYSGSPAVTATEVGRRNRQALLHEKTIISAAGRAALKTRNEPRKMSVGINQAGSNLLSTLWRHYPAKLSWGQVATLTGLKARGGHFNAARKWLRDSQVIDEAEDRVWINAAGIAAIGLEPPTKPLTAAEHISLWSAALPAPAPEILRKLYLPDASMASGLDEFIPIEALAASLDRKPAGGHWNTGISNLRANELVEIKGKTIRLAEMFRKK